MIFGSVEGKIPGARVVDLVAAERFFELGEAVPGMLRVFGSGDAPEVESVGAGVFGVENHLDEEGGAGGEFAMFVIGGGVGVEAGAVVIVDEGGGDRDFGIIVG